MFGDALEGVPGKVLQPMRAGRLTLPVFTSEWHVVLLGVCGLQRVGGVYRKQAAAFRPRVYLQGFTVPAACIAGKPAACFLAHLQS